MMQEDPRFSAAISAMENEDFDASFPLMKELATEGRARAQQLLAWHYHKGVGVEQDDAKAVRWWREAAMAGIPEAQQGLGWAYETGRGVRRDVMKAYHWYSLAVSGGDTDARYNLIELAGKLSPEQVREAEGQLHAI